MNTDYFIQTAIEISSNIVSNLFWIILLVSGIKLIVKSINAGFDKIVRDMPKWISQYGKIRREELQVAYAVTGRKII